MRRSMTFGQALQRAIGRAGMAGLLAWITVSAAHAQPVALSSFAEAPGNGVYAFPSWTPKSLGELMRGDKGAEGVNIVGHLFLPPGNDKVPAVVMVHGSGGVYPAELDYWPRQLNAAGIAVFVLDMFGPRGVRSTAEDQSQVPFAADVADSFAALKLLATHPRIDAGRIAAMGFSRGGTAVLRSAVEPVIAAQKLPAGLQYAAIVPTYSGGCSGIFRLVVRPGVFSKAPMLFVHGSADDYAPMAPCQDYAEKIRAAGTPVEFAVIEGAQHKFDDDDPRRRFLARVTRTRADCPIEVDLDGFRAFDRRTGARLEGPAYKSALATCRDTGATVQSDAKARDQAAAAVIAFLKKTFGM